MITTEPERDSIFALRKPQTHEERVFDIMADGRWHTLSELSRQTGYAEASVSCALRVLRRHEYGGFTVNKRPIPRTQGRGRLEYEYQLTG